MPLISIITASKNLIATGRASAFRRCVESVSCLSTPHEHIIIDGKSDDATINLLEEISRSTTNLRFISEPDTGVYNAFNKGIRAAKGKWIYFIGSDDYVFAPEVMDKVIAEAEQSGCEWIISKVRNSDGSCWFSGAKDFGNILLYKPYGHQGVLMTKELLSRLGFFDESYRIVSDFKMCLQAHLKNVPHRLVMKSYAEFSVSGGLSNTDKREYTERTDVTIKLLHLKERESKMLVNYQLLPLRVILPLLFHKNTAIRIGAFHACLRRLANCIGLIDSNGRPRI